jgi:hypothetical protein
MKKHHGLSFGFAVQAAFCAAAIAAVFTLAGCPTEDDDPTSSIPSGNLGAALTITNEQVYKETYGDTGDTTYTEIDGDKTVTVTGVTGTASITGGKLNLTVTQAPSGSQLSPLSGMIAGLGEQYTVVNASPNDAKIATLSLRINDGSYGSSLYKGSATSSSSSYTSESVSYMYVDKDVTISGTGKTTTETEDGTTGTYKTNDFTLNLKQGWNAVYSKNTMSGSSSSYTATTTLSVGNPALKWSYEED